MKQTRPFSEAARQERTFKLASSSFLFAYMGFVLAIFLADALWLALSRNPDTGHRYLADLFSGSALSDFRAEIRFAIGLSVITAGITSFLSMFLAIPAAYALSRYSFPASKLIDTVIDLPIVMPPLIAGISLQVFFNQTWLGRCLEGLLHLVYTQKGIIVAQFFIAAAFSIRALKATFDQINPRFEAVARTLGCSRFQAFRQVTLPLARNGLVAGLVMTWARAMGEFAPILVFAGGCPFDPKVGNYFQATEVLPIAAYINLNYAHVENAVAATLVMLIISAATLLTFKKLGGQGYIW